MYPRRNKGSNKKALKSIATIVEPEKALPCVLYVHVRLVSRSHSGNPKMADPVNVAHTYKRHFALTIGAHWRKMRPQDPSWRPVAQFEKTTRRRRILKCYGVADPYLGECTSHFFKEIASRSF